MDEQKLIEWLQSQGRVAIAFSGGVDSTFLLACAQKALGNQVKAYTCQSAFVPEWELNEAKAFCENNGILFEIIPLDILAQKEVAQNPIDRCYACKKTVFSAILSKAKEDGFSVVCDGANVDDLGDFRPGSKAAKELGIQSPLQKLGYTKEDIRNSSGSMGLATAKKPAYACLATRIPTDHLITLDALSKIDRAELILHRMGYPAVRVRYHDDLARIELSKDSLGTFLAKEDLEAVAKRIKEVGFRYVAVDLEGYKTGNMNAGKGQKP